MLSLSVLLCLKHRYQIKQVDFLSQLKSGLIQNKTL